MKSNLQYLNMFYYTIEPGVALRSWYLLLEKSHLMATE